MPRLDAVVSQLRRGLADGTWPAGARLPSRPELCRRLRCSPRLLQAAVARLQQAGLVAARPRRGTVALPPRALRVALLLPLPVEHPRHGQLDRGLVRLAGAARADGITVLPRPAWDPATWPALAAGLAEGLFDGCLLRGEPDEHPGLVDAVADHPLVAVGVRSRRRPVPCVHLSHEAVVQTGVERLSAQGCRRLVVLTHRDLAAQQRRLLGPQGGSARLLEVAMDHAAAACQLIDLCLELPVARRPDGLLIAIDALVPAVSAHLLADPERLRGLRLAVHTNRPGLEPGRLAAERVGHDLAETLDCALALLARLRAGKPVPARSVVPARCWSD